MGQQEREGEGVTGGEKGGKVAQSGPVDSSLTDKVFKCI